MRLNKLRWLSFVLVFCCAASSAHHDSLHDIIDNEFRTADYKLRDKYRHPYETLSFFGIRPDMTVVELWPGGGWYSDILAPYLVAEGQFIAAHFDPDTQHPFADFFKESRTVYENKVTASPDWFGDMIIKPFEPPLTAPVAPAGSVDMVLTFRNVHNWLKDGTFDDVIKQVRTLLRPGGIFGVVDHRAPIQAAIDETATDGYVNEQWLTERIESMGFQVVAVSQINSNPNDTADHPNGVWTLPPNLRVPNGESQEKYIDIGESDRFTIKFVKLGR